MSQIDDLVIILLELRSDLHEDFSEEEKEVIHNIAELCDRLPLVQATMEQGEEYAKDMSAKEVYEDMLYKIVGAPSGIHMRAAVRMLIPIIDKKIREG